MPQRSGHADAWTHLDQPPVREPDDGNAVVIRGASVLRQPTDGHCLFHSLAEGVGAAGEEASGQALRVELVEWLRGHKVATHNGSTFAEWIFRDCGMTVETYCATMLRTRRWGGGIEIAAFARSKNVDVHVFEPRGAVFARIAFYRSSTATESVLHLLYVGRSHYDLLQGGHLVDVPSDTPSRADDEDVCGGVDGCTF